MHHRQVYDNDNDVTTTALEQLRVENSLMKFFFNYRQNQKHLFKNIRLFRQEHINYCLKGLNGPLNSGFEVLDASKPWICYWTVHSLNLLEYDLAQRDPELAQRVVDYLGNILQNKTTGGFGGGNGQISHIASTYSAVNCLLSIGTKEAYNIIDREKMYEFLYSLKQTKMPDRDDYKCFLMHVDGESDMRGSYCALNVAYQLNLLNDTLCDGILEYLGKCQTYEGGFAAFPGNEAHGGYAFCGVSALCILYIYYCHLRKEKWTSEFFWNKLSQSIDLNSLVHWTVARQMSFEGGFSGRTNKLVDACYSFWVGATFPLLHFILSQLPQNSTIISKAAKKELEQMITLSENKNEQEEGEETVLLSPAEAVAVMEDATSINDEDEVNSDDSIGETEQVKEASKNASEGFNVDMDNYPELEGGDWLMDHTALQEYELLCCQLEEGGLRDKPGKSRDYYHTCYALSGLSVAQHHLHSNPKNHILVSSVEDSEELMYENTNILGDDSNELEPIYPIMNITYSKALQAKKNFY